MLSFPSSFSKGGSAMYQVGKNGPLKSLPATNDNAFLNVQAKNLKLTESLKSHIYNTDNKFTTFDGYVESKYLVKSPSDGSNNSKNLIYYEDPLKNDIRALRSINMYQFVYSNPIYNIMDLYGKQQVTQDTTGNKTSHYNELHASVITTAGSPSLFNPAMAVNAIGITENVPLLNSVRSNKLYPVYEPTIENLIKGSKKDTGILGNARYRLIDFIYCKDLGKVSNNHLITLRKFANPIGDHIYKWSTRRGQGAMNMQTDHDIGRLITWFGTDDNKLEDICKYEVQMKWNQIENKIEAVESREDDENRGPLGMVINSVSKKYNAWQSSDFGGPGHNLLSSLASKYDFSKIPGSSVLGINGEKQNDNRDVLNRLRIGGDDHKIYAPKNTIRDTHLYDGQLTLNHDIHLTFSYKLRAYDNINPKSAMLDLIGNILEVTYQRGSYWQGENRFIGPPQNRQAWQQANDMIDHAWNKMGGFIKALADGDESFSNIMGNLSQKLADVWKNVSGLVQDGVQQVKELSDQIQNGQGAEALEEKGKAAIKGIVQLDNAVNISGAVKGLLKNTLGRPAMYAMTTLIDGGNCGFWHLTVGNPFNPIMSIGNLIMTGATIEHSGPLGVDDFPTDLKVTVTLKPGRSRDAIEVSRYYTKGLSAIYMPKNRRSASDYHKFAGLNSNYFEQLDKDTIENIKANKTQFEGEAKMDVGYNPNNNTTSTSDTWLEAQQSRANISDTDNAYWSNSIYYEDQTEGTIAIAGTNNPLHYVRSHDQIA